MRRVSIRCRFTAARFLRNELARSNRHRCRMITDIVIRSYSPDFQWLTLCLKSIQRWATGFRRVVVIVPNGHIPPTGTSEIVYYVHESGDGYMEQQVSKLHADCFTDAEFLLFLDSDTIFNRPVCPEDFIVDYRHVRWLYTPYSSLDGGDGQTWKKPTTKAMMRNVEREFMRRHPLVAPRWALREFRDWMWRNHGVSLERYILSQPDRQFSEWNALGAYLWFYHHDKVKWQNTDDDMGTVFVRQSFSWGGLTPELRADLERACA